MRQKFPRRRRGEARIASDPYVRALAGMILLIFIALTIGDFQFKRIARDTFQEDNLARFFSLFYAGSGIVSFVFQLALTPRILARLGVGAGMLVMPTVFGAGSALLLLVARLPVATAMKFADNGFQYTIHETMLQALYVPFQPEIKARTRAFLDAVVKPLSYGAGGVALILLVPHLSVGQLSFATVPLVLAWMATIPVVRRRYLRRLETTLSARGALALDHEALLDPAGRQALVKVLERGETRSVLLALEQLADTRTEQVRGAVVRLVGHREPVLRAAALDWLAGDTGNDRDAVVVALTDPEPAVRTSGAKAYAAIARDEAVEGLALLLSDPARDVRGAAVAVVIGGADSSQKAEIRKLRQFWADRDKADAPRLEWVRIHSVARPAHFPHQRHIKSMGVKACGACHGDVARMPQVWEVNNVNNMGFCINCHVERKVARDCSTCHY